MKKLKNRNYQRIDGKITEAFKNELMNGDVTKLSITDLCKNAGVNRTTFYKHYTEIEEIYFKLQDDFVDKHFTFKESGSYKQFLKDPKKYLENIASQTLSKGEAPYFEKLLHPHYVYRIMHKIENNIFDEIKKTFPGVIKKFGECEIRTDICYFVGGSFSIIVSFIRKEMPCITEEYIINQISSALLLGVEQYKKSL